MKPSKLFLKYKGKIETNTLGDSDIVAFKSHLNNSRQNSTLTKSEESDLFDLINEKKPIITTEQTKKGLTWLKNLWETPLGKERKNNPFSQYEQEVLETFQQFRLVDFRDESTNYHRPDYRPVYRVEGKKGSFDYFAYPWQDGRPIYIV